MKKYSSQIKALRKRLPKRGWVEKVVQYASDKKGNPLVTEHQIRNFFGLKSCKQEDAVLIIEAAKKAAEHFEREKEKLSGLLQVS